jgi:hypothetical protein
MDLTTLREYLKIHRISLIQDLDQLHSKDEDYPFVAGQINLINHLLEYIEETK